jgi:N-methylhydantoinase A
LIKESVLAGIDTGGTFTDVVVLDGGGLRHCKVLSTPDDPSRAIFEGLDRLGLADKDIRIIHGTTVGTNAVLENKGARVAYVTSEGFADVLTLGRQNREQVYSLRQPPVAPPVPSSRCLQVSTRIAADGSLLQRAGQASLEALREQLEALDIESVAVNLLFSFLQPGEEQRIAKCLGERWFVSCSSEILPELREYERGIATWLNASVGPVMARYLERLASRLPRARISVLQSAGTTIGAGQAASQAVRLLLSGPAGGLSAAVLAGRVSGRQRLLTFDMGGTSTDVALLDGEIPVSNESRIGRWPLAISSVDIHTIGAGGGSIARVDEGGLLLVGPESAGASPGPACYGQGGTGVTVTDANLVLGRIPRDALLGGYLPLEFEPAAEAMDHLAAELGCSRLDAARGVIRLANEHMARALRVISVERGHDPRDYSLFGFGGAGGLHACDLADLVGMRRVVLPARAGVLSAQGMLSSQPGRDLSLAMLQDVEGLDDKELAARFEALARQAKQQLEDEISATDELQLRRLLELRYRGQSSTIVLEFQPGEEHAERFHAAHQSSSGHRLEREVELVNIRLRARGPAVMTSLLPEAASKDGAAPEMVYLSDLKGMVPVYQRAKISNGTMVSGPAIVRETGATAWIAPGWQATPDDWGNLILENISKGG